MEIWKVAVLRFAKLDMYNLRSNINVNTRTSHQDIHAPRQTPLQIAKNKDATCLLDCPRDPRKPTVSGCGKRSSNPTALYQQRRAKRDRAGRAGGRRIWVHREHVGRVVAHECVSARARETLGRTPCLRERMYKMVACAMEEDDGC